MKEINIILRIILQIGNVTTIQVKSVEITANRHRLVGLTAVDIMYMLKDVLLWIMTMVSIRSKRERGYHVV